MSNSGDSSRPKILSRVTLRKFDGDDTTGEPVETLVFKEEGFDELVAELEAKVKMDKAAQDERRAQGLDVIPHGVKDNAAD